jgi:hypothetical protein
MVGQKARNVEEVANIPPQLSDLHCFTETEGVITTSTYRAATVVTDLGRGLVGKLC